MDPFQLRRTRQHLFQLLAIARPLKKNPGISERRTEIVRLFGDLQSDSRAEFFQALQRRFLCSAKDDNRDLFHQNEASTHRNRERESNWRCARYSGAVMSDSSVSEVVEKCSCGTVLVPNSRFCHRCGRPVGETAPEAVADPVVIAIPRPVTQAPTEALPIGFRNPVAVRIAFMMSLGITLIHLTPVLNYLAPLWWGAAGWFAVRFYRRLTGVRLVTSAGARLGFLTGVFVFIGIAVFLALVLGTSMRKELMDQMIRQNPETASIVNDPTMFAGAMAMVVVMMFVFVVGICTAGAAMSASSASRDK